MEHLPLPADHDPTLTSTPLEYVGGQYDYSPFDTYPDRVNFDLVNNVFRGQEPDKPAAVRFYQTWLVPGFLHAVLEITDPSPFFKTVSGKTYVTTANLEAAVLSHSQRIFEMKQDPRLSWFERMGKYLRIASRAFHEIEVANEGKRVWKTVDDLTARVQLSIALLGEALMQYVFHVGRRDNERHKNDKTWQTLNMVLPRWRSGPLPNSIFERNGWCISERERSEWSQPSVKVFMASMRLTRNKEAHGNCTKKACVANTIDESVYQTKHVVEGCDCEFLGPDVDEISACLDAKKIPVIRIEIVDEDFVKQVTCESVDLRKLEDGEEEGGDEFVGISHVWSDGLGNARENKLPRCQLVRLAKFVQGLPAIEKDEDKPSTSKRLSQLFSNKKKSQSQPAPSRGVLIWMDTLCVPLEPTHRKIAIHTMDRVYQQAKAIIVLDKQLEAYPYTTDEEAMCRIYMSGWMRRVWTFQEAILGGKRLVFQFKNQSVQELPMNTRLSERARDNEMELHTILNFAMTLEDDSYFDLRVWYLELWHRSAEAIKMERGFLTAIQLAKKISGYNKMGFKQRHQILPALWESMERRSTTKEEDRALIASTVLKLDTAHLLAQPRSQRMGQLYRLLVEVPAYVLFAKSPRLPDEPFRWAPSAFQEGGWGKGTRGSTNVGLVTDRGIDVKFDGFIFKDNLPREGAFWTIVDGVSYSILCVKPDLPDENISQEDFNDITARSPHGFAIIVSDQEPYTFEVVNERGALNTYNIRYGTLVSIKEDKKGLITGRFECLTRVGEITNIDEELKQSTQDLQNKECQGACYVRKQHWLVV